jgi:hypothetical protein
MLFNSITSLRTIFPKINYQTRKMITITDGVEFDTIAREWRLKWSPDDNKKSLASVQQTLVVFLPALKAINGVKSVQRIVCGGCLDYKVIISLPAEKFADWVCIYSYYYMIIISIILLPSSYNQ